MERIVNNRAVVGFRRLFYLVSPNETSFETIERVPRYVDEAIPFFLALIVLEIIVLFYQKRNLPRFNDGFSSVANGMLSLLHNLLFRSTELAAFIWVYDRFNVVSLPWDNPWTWFFGFIGVDFCYYWVHRCGHEVNIFWAGHQAHHSSEDYNLTTALRQSFILKYLSWIFYLPLALVMPPSVFLVHSQFNLLYQFWIHTETVRTLGPLEWIFNTPSHHRVHHGRNRYCIDKNYGGTLIIFDRIFGTFEAEIDEVVYGLVHNINTWDPLYAQFCHFIYMAKTFRDVKGFGNKMSVIFKGPGWSPGKPRLGLPEDIPHVEAPVVKYDKCLPLWTNLYMWAHFGILLLGYSLTSENKQSLSAVFISLCIIYMIYSLTSFGALYDHKDGAPLMEFLRCLLYVIAVRTTSTLYVTTGLNLGYIVYMFHVISLCLWTCICIRQFTVSVKTKPD